MSPNSKIFHEVRKMIESHGFKLYCISTQTTENGVTTMIEFTKERDPFGFELKVERIGDFKPHDGFMKELERKVIEITKNIR